MRNPEWADRFCGASAQSWQEKCTLKISPISQLTPTASSIILKQVRRNINKQRLTAQTMTPESMKLHPMTPQPKPPRSSKSPLTDTASGRSGRVVAHLGMLLAATASVQAGSRRFAYSYETTTMAAGAMELETWATWKTHPASDPSFERFDLRHEFEYGVTDRLQLAFYFLDWRYQESAAESGTTTFRDVAVEAIYNLTNPNASAFGSALYGEIKGSGDFIELEGKLLLQKNLGPWVFVYNIGGEIVWENDYNDDEAELMQSAGVAYQINPAWSAGAELLHEIAVPEVEHLGDSAVYLGPNLSWRSERLSITLAGLWQLTGRADEPDFQLRTLFSVDF